MLARNRVSEIMDDPALSRTAHREALDGIARLNRLSGAERLIWREMINLQQRSGARKLRVLDVATGGGDLPIALLKRAKRSKLELEIHGCDISEQGLEEARRRAAAANANIHFFQLDALKNNFPTGYDVVMTSLFTHHLDENQVVRLLCSMKGAADSLVLIDDLERSLLNLILVSCTTYMVTKSFVARHDGPASVRGSYTRAEMLQLATAAGLKGARAYTHVPCRFLLSWTNQADKQESH